MELTEKFAEVSIHDMQHDFEDVDVDVDVDAEYYEYEEVEGEEEVVEEEEGEGKSEEEQHEEEEGEYEEQEQEGDEEGEEYNEEESSEEEGSVSDADYDMREYGIHRALPVRDGGESDMDGYDGPPLSAEDYLRQVRREAAGLPDVITAEIDARRFDGRRTAYVSAAMQQPLIAGAARPPDAFLTSFLPTFHALRQNVQGVRDNLPQANLDHLPSMQDEMAWQAICIGSAKAPQNVSETLANNMAFLASLPQAKLTTLLQYNVAWLGAMAGCPHHNEEWIYAICALLETPLHDTTEATLRDLLRHCAAAAEQLPRSGGELAGATGATAASEQLPGSTGGTAAAEQLPGSTGGTAGPKLARIHVLVAIAGAYFKQDEGLAAAAGFLSM